MPEFMFCEKMVLCVPCTTRSSREDHERGVSGSKGGEENNVLNLNWSV